MSNSPIIQINVKKTHLMAIAILLLIGAATSTVNIRDTTKMFDRLEMDGNKVVNATEYRFTGSFVREYDKNNNGKIGISELGDAGQDFSGGELSIQKLQILGEYFTTGKQISRGVKAAPLSEDGKIIASGAYTGTKNGPTQAGNFTFSSDINLQGNNIYNAGNTGGGGGLGDGTGLEWYKSSTTNEDYSDDKTFSFGCPSGENLVAYHGATSGQAHTPPPWYGSWLGPIDTSGNNIDYDHAGYVNHHIAGRVMGINSSDTDSLSVSIRMDPVAPGYDKTFATINVGCLPGQ